MFRTPQSIFATVFVLVVGAPDSFADDYAHAVVSYSPGTNPAAGFSNPAMALGAPARVTGESYEPGVVSPFNPAFEVDELVSIGAGGSLVLSFDPPLTNDGANPFGTDFIVFGNSFFSDIQHPNGVVGGMFTDGGIVEASADGVTWIAFSSGVADGAFPTMGYVDAEPYSPTPGMMECNAHLPLNPSLTIADFIGLEHPAIVALYAGSAGGSGFDLGAIGLQQAVAIRIRVAPGMSPNVEIDAVSRVLPKCSPADLNCDGAINGVDLGYLLAAFGTTDPSADLDASGTVDANDLTVVLAGWSV